MIAVLRGHVSHFGSVSGQQVFGGETLVST
jgi:hypothetical protein